MPRRLLLLLTLALVAVPAAPAAADAVPTGYAYEDAWFDAHDGTRLHAASSPRTASPARSTR